MKPINENGTSRKHSPEWNFLKTLFSRVHEDRRKRNFSKTLKSHYQFQATPRNIRNLFKTADGASSMRSRVSYRFQIDSSYTCGRAKTMRKRYEWTRIFENREKKVAFSNEYRYVLTGPKIQRRDGNESV